jgi:hypothetical protein
MAGEHDDTSVRPIHGRLHRGEGLVTPVSVRLIIDRAA